MPFFDCTNAFLIYNRNTYVMGREHVDYHIQSPEITSNHVTAQKDTQVFFYAHPNSHRCLQQL